MPPGSAPPVYVPNYLVFAILATVFCCLPAGIPAIVYAAQVNGKLQAGDIAGAQIASKNAKMWCWIALGAGLAIMFIYALLMAIGVISHMHR
jgi:interferon-induced transmembrane protein